ncbi:hypothetical protein Tco_1421483, partial [Tanacetum coccineum]
TPRIDKGKGIAIELDEDPSKRLVPASTIIRPDPDELVKVEFMINGKIVYLTEQEIQEPEVIKVVQEEAEKIRLGLIKITSAKAEFNRRRAEEYMWTMTNRIKLEPITDVRIHPNTKPIVASVFRNNDKRNFDVHQPFKLKKFPEELGIQSALHAPVPEQALFQTSGKKRKHMELEPEVKVPGLECNRSLPEGVPFVNHMVRVESLVSYLVMASMVKTEENARFSLKLKKMIVDHPDQDKLKSKKVKLEALGYHLE